MFELLILVVFVLMILKLIGLVFRLTWGAAKIIASILMVIAVPALFACLIFAGGIALLLPLALIGIAFGIVKACT